MVKLDHIDRLQPGRLHPFNDYDVPHLVDARAQQRAEHPFLIWEPFEGPTQTWTFARFAHDVASLAGGLAKRGIKAGDFVLVHLDNCPETILAWYACARLGAVAVTTNARSAPAELAYFADHCGAVAGITQPAFAELVAANAPNLKWLAVTDHDAGAASAQPPEKGFRFAELMGDPADAPLRPADPLAPVGVQYTSGTTSRPKGVLWTHANALWGFRINAVHEDLRRDDVHLSFLPLFHTNAQAYCVGASLWAGCTVVVQPRFSASRFWPISLKHGCTWNSTIPFTIRALMQHEVPKDHSYRLWGTAVCNLPTDAHFGVRTLGWWGMTETMTHGIVGDVHDANRSMMIGRPAPEYGISVRDDDGREVEPGETGHLLVKGIAGLSLFYEYLNNPQATADTYSPDGWFMTGDRITRHEDGFLQFADRDKDMLKVGGENVAASEIERVIVEFPEAREVAVVAAKHEMLDEVPVAFILVEGGVDKAPPDLAERVLATCRDRLADFKVPRAVHLVDDFPRSTLEKIAKAELRKQLNDMQGETR